MAERNCRGRKLNGSCCRLNPRPYFIGYQALTQLIPTGVEDVQLWNGVTAVEGIKATSDGKFYMRERGIYAIQGDIQWASGGDFRIVVIFVNGQAGITYPRFGRASQSAIGGVIGEGLVFACHIVLNVGDFIEVRVQQGDVGSRNTIGDNTGTSQRSEISIAMIARV